MKIIVCDVCGSHEAPYAELHYLDSANGTDEVCQGCIGRLKEIGQLVKLPEVTAEVAAIDVLHKIDYRLSEIMARFKGASSDTGVTPRPGDTPLQAAHRSGGVLWGKNET